MDKTMYYEFITYYDKTKLPLLCGLELIVEKFKWILWNQPIKIQQKYQKFKANE